MASMCGERVKYLRNGFTMLEMTKEFHRRLICVGNEAYVWEISKVFEKRLKYVGNDVDLWEMC